MDGDVRTVRGQKAKTLDDGRWVVWLSCAAPKCSSAVESRIRDWEQLGGDSECSDGRRFVAEMVTCPLAFGAVLRSSRSRR